MKQFRFEFTSAEVEETTNINDDNTLVFITKKPGVPIPTGKKVYSEVLKEKASQCLSSKPRFSTKDGLKNLADNYMACYLECHHNIRSSVKFKKSDMKVGDSLRFSLDIKCTSCLDQESNPDSNTQCSSHSTTASSSSVTMFTCPIEMAFNEGAHSITLILSKALQEIRDNANPESHLVNMRNVVSEKIVLAWENATRNFVNSEVPHLQSSLDHGAESQEPVLRDAHQMLRDGMSGTAKRRQQQQLQNGKRRNGNNQGPASKNSRT